MPRLTKNQREAFTRFSSLKVGALFMEQGTGKTRTALELINYNVGKFDKVLWFTPCSTKENLKKEIEKWNFNFEVNIYGWETLSQSNTQYLNLLDEIDNKKLFIVADESIFIKNGEAVRYNRLMKIAQNSVYRLILNGTPITKNEWDLYYQMNFLSPKIINMSEIQFLNTFYKHVKYKKSGKKAGDFYVLSNVNIDYLHKLIDPYIFKCDFKFDRKEIENVELITPRVGTLERYEELKNNSLDNLQELEGEEIICLIQQLNIISSTDKNKAKAIARFIKGRKCIVFYQYKEEGKQIKRYLNEYLMINGDVKQNERDQILNDFELNNIPLLISFGTGAFGLNLQHCNEIIFSSLTFDYAKILQAKARIRRIGQEKDITYTYFDVDLPINNFVKENIKKKQYLEKILLERLKNGEIRL